MNITLRPGTTAANDDFGHAYAALLDSAGSVHTVHPRAATNTQHSGNVVLDNALLRQLRRLRLLSQQDLADECWRRNIRVSVATIKRAESGHAVRYRVARELARCFDVPVMQLIGLGHKDAHQRH